MNDTATGKTIGNLFDFIKLDDQGLVAAIIQHHGTGQVLMLGYMTPETLRETLETGRAVFWSRSRKQRWMKGETSGNMLQVREVRADCDADALVLQCEPVGPTCHTGETSCFYRLVGPDGTVTLAGDGAADK
jgi:phosphoribosyl-AMP cyclohydrolase